MLGAQCDRGPIELLKSQLSAHIACSQSVEQDADGNLLMLGYAVGIVCDVVNPGRVASDGNIGTELVQLSIDGKGISHRHQGCSALIGLNRVGQGSVSIEKRLQDGSASSRHGGVTGPVRGMSG